MRSLAAEQQAGAIGVILSGTATDGTLGLEAIKAEGGITLSQDEKSAQYPGMPASAIASGCFDFVLPPEDIVRELVRISRHPYVSRPMISMDLDDSAVGGDPEQFNKIFDLLRKGTGLDFSSYKRSTIRRRIARRMTLHKFTTIGDYVGYLQKTRPEVEALSQDLLIKVTTFFRDEEAFEALRRKVIPTILKNKKSVDPIRFWVPGCSTGEEVFSIGICLLEAINDLSPGRECQIFATDISDSAMERARSGFYSENITQDVAPERLRRYFTKTGQGYRIAKVVRDMCVFARQDLTKDPPFSKLDLISCRNVLIYMGSDLQRRIFPIFHYALNPGGFLMLGSAESTGSFSDLFSPADKRGKIYVKKSAVPDSRLAHAAAAARLPRLVPGKREPKPQVTNSEGDLFREADRITLAQYAPAGVVLNDALEIIQFRGHTAPYLEHGPGKPTVNILKLVREGLMFELKAATEKAAKEEVSTRTRPIELRQGNQVRHVTIDVVPIRSALSEKPFLLVLFQSLPSGSTAGKGPVKISPQAESRLVLQLRRELNAVREELQTVIEEQEAAQEEFKSANEEILSSNEELQSTNEELETAKEELQSANEELTTLNEELLTRNTDLAQLNSDITNLLYSISFPILMLSQDMKIRRFTPMAGTLLNLIPGDVGRPISDINPNIELPNLESMVTRVLETMTVKDHELRDKDDRWYSMRIRPYRTLENKIDGATVTFVDIDALKKGQLAEAVIETIRGPLLILDSRLHVKLANRSFFRMFETGERETLNKPLYELGNGQWNIPALRTLLEEILPRKTTVEDYKVEHTFPTIGRRAMMVNARRVRADHDNDELILFAVEEIPNSK